MLSMMTQAHTWCLVFWVIDPLVISWWFGSVRMESHEGGRRCKDCVVAEVLQQLLPKDQVCVF
jgi:hypothetical protein